MSIPTDASGAVSLTRPDGTATGVRVSLPSAAPSKAVVASDGTVTYDNALTATDLAVQAFDHGVRIQTVLSGDASPTEFTYPVDVPSGGSMSLSPDGGVLIVSPDGSPAGGFAAPWAKDASGAIVATSYEIRGNSVVQHVDHSGQNYPIVADPWLWIALISSASWSYHLGAWVGK